MPCQKALHYERLERLGLPVPTWHLTSADTLHTLKHLGPDHWGSNFVGFRTELKDCTPGAHKFPHVIVHVDEYDQAPYRLAAKIKDTTKGKQTIEDYHIVVNSAFTEYRAHAVVALVDDCMSSTSQYTLVGDLFEVTNHEAASFVLRDAMTMSPLLDRVKDAIHKSAEMSSFLRRVRSLLYRSCLLNTHAEVSLVCTPTGTRIVFWGMR